MSKWRHEMRDMDFFSSNSMLQSLDFQCRHWDQVWWEAEQGAERPRLRDHQSYHEGPRQQEDNRSRLLPRVRCQRRALVFFLRYPETVLNYQMLTVWARPNAKIWYATGTAERQQSAAPTRRPPARSIRSNVASSLFTSRPFTSASKKYRASTLHVAPAARSRSTLTSRQSRRRLTHSSASKSKWTWWFLAMIIIIFVNVREMSFVFLYELSVIAERIQAV